MHQHVINVIYVQAIYAMIFVNLQATSDSFVSELGAFMEQDMLRTVSCSNAASGTVCLASA